jgi:crossover junction endodeoxyribonuclease RuvC
VTACVIGLDLSLTSTGIAVIDRDGPITLRRIATTGKTTDTLAERWYRLDRIVGPLKHLVDRHQPALIVIEGPSYGSRTGHQHDRSGLWWLVVDALPEPIVEVPPTVRMRYATGKGQAQKDAVLAAVVRRYPHADVTGNDVADALVLAAMGRRWLGCPIETSLPNTHLAAMDGVRWPERVTT